MSLPVAILLIIALLVPLWLRLRRNYMAGLCYAMVLLVSLSPMLRIPMPGSLPQFTIHRLILIVLVIFWLRRPDRRVSGGPLFGLFIFWGLTNLVSLLFASSDFVVSLKRYLDFVLEASVFFFLVVTSLKSEEDTFRILRAAWLGVSVVAVVAFIQKYTGHNLLEPAGATGTGVAGYVEGHHDITASYQHRILLGTGMAMGWPLAFALLLNPLRRPSRNRLIWLSIALLIAGCYFSNSRGPWLASVVAGFILFTTGGGIVRKKLAILGVVALVVFAARPGIWRMLHRDAEATANSNSIKGGTFQYRLVLWEVAWAQISRSPVSLLFGCGLGCGATSTVDWKLWFRGGKDWEIWSWDNELAYDLYQSGIIGFAASLALYGGLLWAAWRNWRRAGRDLKPVAACLLASLAAYCFMLTNVMMFSKPLNFLFWSAAAVTCVIGRQMEEASREPALAPAGEEHGDWIELEPTPSP